MRACHHVWDLGIFAQAIQQISLANFNPLLTTGRGIPIFNDHFDPILILLSPLGKWGDPSFTILLIEWAFLIATAAVLYCRGPTSREGTLRATLFLFSIALFSAVSYPVHPATWSVLILAVFFQSVRTERWRWALILAASLILFKEEYVYILGWIGLGLIPGGSARLGFQKVPIRAPLTLLLLSFGAWILIFKFGPQLFGGIHDYTSDFLNPWKLAPLQTFSHRIWGEGWSSDFFWTCAPLLPVVLLQLRSKKPLEPAPLLTLSAFLGIRFVTGKHGFHYQIPLLLCAIEMTHLETVFEMRAPLRRWVLASICILLLVPMIPKLGKYSAKTLFFGGTRECPSSPTRLAGLKLIQETLQKDQAQLPLVVQGRILPRFVVSAPKGNIFPLESTSRVPEGEFWLISEHPSLPRPSFWPLSLEEGRHKLEEIAKLHPLLEDHSTEDFVFQKRGIIE